VTEVWLGVFVFLVLSELVLRRGYAFSLSLPALLMAYGSFLFPTSSLRSQGIVFTVLALCTLFAWRHYLRYQAPLYQQESFELNSRQYIGRRWSLDSATQDCCGKTEIDQQIWHFRAQQEIAANTEVEVYGVDGVILKIRDTAS
jgi:membrane protein implicated in regulation of membrane protease activity